MRSIHFVTWLIYSDVILLNDPFIWTCDSFPAPDSYIGFTYVNTWFIYSHVILTYYPFTPTWFFYSNVILTCDPFILAHDSLIQMRLLNTIHLFRCDFYSTIQYSTSHLFPNDSFIHEWFLHASHFILTHDSFSQPHVMSCILVLLPLCIFHYMSISHMIRLGIHSSSLLSLRSI